MTEFLGTSYFYKDKIIGVCRGLGDRFFVGYHSKNGCHRVKSSALPACETPEDAEEYLYIFAKRERLAVAEAKPVDNS